MHHVFPTPMASNKHCLRYRLTTTFTNFWLLVLSVLQVPSTMSIFLAMYMFIVVLLFYLVFFSRQSKGRMCFFTHAHACANTHVQHTLMHMQKQLGNCKWLMQAYPVCMKQKTQEPNLWLPVQCPLHISILQQTHILSLYIYFLEYPIKTGSTPWAILWIPGISCH